jgi:Phage late control gene D protein (GPD).
VTDSTKKAKFSHTSIEEGKAVHGEWDTGEGSVSVGDLEDDQTDDKVNADQDAEDSGGEGDGGGGNGGGTREALAGDWETDGDAAAVLKAKSHCRDKNKRKEEGQVEMSIGNPLVAAGQTFNLVGCGQYDGTWFIESAHHTVGPEYKTTLKIHRCLEGY